MADQQVDPALSAANYTPPAHVVGNADVQAYVQQAVAKAVADLQAAQAAANAPVVRSPDEQARADVDNAGAGLGVDERLGQIYRVLAHVLTKVGL